jgi:hypothetical protein
MSDRPPVLIDDDTEVERFTPKRKVRSEASQREDMNFRRLAAEAGFPSRAPKTPHREPMIWRTGRSATFATKSRPELLESFYEIVRQNGWKVSETFEVAVELLIKEYGK